MQQIFILNPKGGCGKTTIATTLAGYIATHGARVSIIDHDKQKSSIDWANARPQACKKIQVFSPSHITPATMQNTYLIHDLPAGCDIDIIKASIHKGDAILVPVLPSPTDIKAFMRFFMRWQREGLLDLDVHIGIIANRLKTNTIYTHVLNTFLAKLNLPVVASLRDSQNYIRAMDRGLTLFDLPASKVKEDTQKWEPMIKWLNLA